MISATYPLAEGAKAFDDLVAHPQNRWITVDTGDGSIECLSPAAVMEGAMPRYGPVPTLDEHGEALRREFSD